MIRRRFGLTAFLLFLVSLCLGPKVWAAPVVVNTCTINEDGSGPNNCTISSVGAHHQIIAFSWTNNTTIGNYTFSDTFGLSYVAKCEQFQTGSPDNDFTLLTANTGTNSGSDTFTQLNHQFGFAFVTVLEVSGLNTYDTCSGATGTTSGSQVVSSGNLTTAGAGEYLVSGAFSTNTALMSVGSGYTSRASINGGAANYFNLAQDKLAGAAGSYNSTVTVGATSAWQQVVAAFTVAGPPVPRHGTGFY